MTEVLRWMLFAGVVLLFCIPVVISIVAVILLQNWQRRRQKRAMAATFGVDVDLDPASRFTRATPSERGTLDGRRIVISAEAGRQIFYNVYNIYNVGAVTHFRADLGHVTVSAPAREDDCGYRPAGRRVRAGLRVLRWRSAPEKTPMASPG